MASYKLFFKRSAEKELHRIPKSDIHRIVQKVHALSEEPRPSGACMLKGEGRYWRIRQGDYRVVYEVNDSSHEISILKVGHRREVYD